MGMKDVGQTLPVAKKSWSSYIDAPSLGFRVSLSLNVHADAQISV
jgi:hypothetical protein